MFWCLCSGTETKNPQEWDQIKKHMGLLERRKGGPRVNVERAECEILHPEITYICLDENLLCVV